MLIPLICWQPPHIIGINLMSESPSAPAPLSSGHLERIKQDAQRGMGASSGDTVRLVTELSLHRVALAPLPAVDYTELQARAEAANAVTGNVNLELSITSAAGSSQEEVNAVTLFYGMATPAAFLDVIDDVGRHRAQCQSLTAQVAVLQSDANSWQSGYDVGRRMGTKLALDDRQPAKRYRYLCRRLISATADFDDKGNPVLGLLFLVPGGPWVGVDENIDAAMAMGKQP